MKIAVIGHFGFGHDYYDGQTIKTKTITSELNRLYGEKNVNKIDTYGGIKYILKLLKKLYKVSKIADEIIILPAQNGLKVIAPILWCLSNKKKVNIHYIVIGGWLPEYIKNNKYLYNILSNFRGIYVETKDMLEKLNRIGMNNVYIMPNCKRMDIVSILQQDEKKSKYRFCTFSRVMKEKGIENAIYGIKTINEKFGEICSLDIYGQVQQGQESWFDSVIKSAPKYVKYCGIVESNKITNTLCNYYGVLFPTYYDGEGFAGTLLDSMAAGVPSIVSDWHYNKEIIYNNYNGYVFKTLDDAELIKCIEKAISFQNVWWQMKLNCVEEAKKYTVHNVIKILINNFSS